MWGGVCGGVYVRVCVCKKCEGYSYSLLIPSPMLGEDFLSDLKLHTIHCLVGPQTAEPLANRTSFYANVERLHMVPGSDSIFNDTGEKIQKLKIITEVGGEEEGRVGKGRRRGGKMQ